MAHLRGPNIWTYRAVIEAIVDIGELEDFPSNTLPGFYDRLTAWLPGLIEHRCSVGRRGGFLMRLRDGTWPGHILEHVALELQTQAGMKTGFGKARMTHEHGVYKVVIRTRNEAIGKLAIQSARDLVMAAINDRPYDLAATIATLTDMVDRQYLGPSTACIVDAASERGIPHIRLNEGNLVQLGHGAAQRRIWTAETDRTSAIAEGISRDKDLTKQLLAGAGVPVPEGRAVESAEAAWEAAEDIGLPVVVKPSDGNHARGVSLNLKTREEVMDAFAAAEKEGSEVLVESFIPGQEHRLLVVGNQVVAATRGEIIRVGGDGKSSIAQLIDLHVNTDPRRGEEEHLPLETLRADDPVLLLLLQRQGLTPASVLPRGESAVVQRTGNMAIDVTAQVHPDIAEQVALAARVVGLDIAGIDLVVEDIAKPLAAQGGAIVEVNAGPGLLMHLKPAVGRSQPVGEAIAKHLFPGNHNGRVPIVGLIGDGQSALAARLIASLLQLHGQQTALACRDGLFLGTRQLSKDDAMGYDPSERMLINRTVQAAVFETSPRHILSEGLPYDRCQVGVVMAMPGAAGLDDLYITEDEQLPNIVRTQIDVVLPQGAAVLNADDPQVLALADYSDGEVLLYSLDSANAALAAHRARKGRFVFARDHSVVLAQGADEMPLLNLSAPVFCGVTHPTPRDVRPHVLAAVATAWAMGVPTDLIRAGLLHFGETQPAAAVH
ncbi:cyanophycin synthetase [Ottowia testudinis]|uniref:Cyanophycin synthetase n=1 Tax=Ottowia testudinis TaxID=2816950 RepID=A0A975CPM0_9BURK|nr:cyanophycin synthetase [Ottowia testudinis]QTD47368.1 cyanophycin synthetase [Ottowia testudinis]